MKAQRRLGLKLIMTFKQDFNQASSYTDKINTRTSMTFFIGNKANMNEYVYFLRQNTSQPTFPSNISPPYSRLQSKPCNKLAWSRQHAEPCAFWFLAWLNHQHWRWRRHVPPKRLFTFTEPHRVICQKTGLFITTILRTSNSKCPKTITLSWDLELHTDCITVAFSVSKRQ
jgi:hypothetical protein